MSDPWDGLTGPLLDAVRGALREHWGASGVEDFARLKVRDMAREKWGALNAATEADRAFHEENLRDLAAHVRDEALKLAGRASAAAKGALSVVLETLGGALLSFAKSWLESKIGG